MDLDEDVEGADVVGSLRVKPQRDIARLKSVVVRLFWALDSERDQMGQRLREVRELFLRNVRSMRDIDDGHVKRLVGREVPIGWFNTPLRRA